MKKQSLSTRVIPLIILTGPLPPPMHGMAAVNDSIFSLLADKKQIVIDLSRELAKNPWAGYLIKYVRALLGCFRILTLPLRREKTFYSSVDDGLGSLLIALLTLTARLRHCRIILHHHSYKYLTYTAWNMRLLVSVAGARATHVFLCDQMESVFRARYPQPFNAIICPNPVSDPAMIAHFTNPSDPTPQPILTIGFISNLMFEKGVREFIDMICQAPAQGIALRGVMAGSAFKPEVQAFLDDAKQELGERLELLGAVHGARKVAFFESIDVLIFPSHSEAFPLVLMEGLLAGCPLITWARGCIPIFSKFDTARVLPPEADFPTMALPVLDEWAKTREGLAALKSQAHRDGMALHRRHLDARDRLIKTISV